MMSERPPAITNAPSDHPSMDFAFLRAEGVRHIRRLAGHLWTDHNAHDPGITILEQLCYALTDLNYRIGYDIQDLLAGDPNASARWLFVPEQVLVSGPVTNDDLRKLLLDVPGVQNAWLEEAAESIYTQREWAGEGKDERIALYLEPGSSRQPLALRGLRRVQVAPQADRQDLDDLRTRLHAWRPLAEDFVFPGLLSLQTIRIDAAIEVGHIDDPNRLLADIYVAVAAHIAPCIRFRNAREMRELGRSTDEIFLGPRLTQGFIDDADLEHHQRKSELRKSDLVKVIMDVPGVRSIRRLSIAPESSSAVGPDGSADIWYLQLDPQATPVLDARSQMTLVRGGVPLTATKPDGPFHQPPTPRQNDPADNRPADNRPAADDRQLETYHSIQHDFPEVYGIGPRGLPASADPARHAQARQLKAYLCLFEQLLANAFSQLAHAKDLLSPGSEDAQTDNQKTYFGQSLQDIVPGAADVIESFDLPALLEDDAATLARQHRFLNHLLARVGEQLTDLAQQAKDPSESQQIVAAKRAMLRDLPNIGNRRGCGPDVTSTAKAGENLSSLERRIRYKLGWVVNEERPWLADLTDHPAGFHLLEHILLRPGQEDRDQWTNGDCRLGRGSGLLADPIRTDPYSAQLSFVFPGWAPLSVTTDFIRQTVRAATPAHLHVHLHWLSQDEMREFEDVYQVWLAQQAQRTPQSPAGRDARDHLLNLLGLGSTWPRRDLEVAAPELVPANESARIQLLASQPGVTYQLCDQDGLPIPGQEPVNWNGDTTEIRTPKMTETRTYTIRAWRANQALANRDKHRVTTDQVFLTATDMQSTDVQPADVQETYLNQMIRLRVGINTKLKVKFLPAEGQIVDGATLTIDYGGTATIQIGESQEGVSYEVVDAAAYGADDKLKPGEDLNKSRLSTATIMGTGATISLEVVGLKEDQELRIRAFRPTIAADDAPLTTKLTVQVRPNLQVGVTAEPSVAYNASASISLSNEQATVVYELYQHVIEPREFGDPTQAVPAATGYEDLGDRAVEIEQVDPETQQNFKLTKLKYTRPDPRHVQTTELPKFAADVAHANGLQQASLFLVLVTKHNEKHWLDQACVVLVEPNAELVLKESADGTAVVVNEPQSGVRYQLLDKKRNPIGQPGYPDDDRGVGRSRVGIDSRVGPVQPPAEVELPADPGRYIVRATRYLGFDYSVEPPVSLPEPIALVSVDLTTLATISNNPNT